MEPDNTPVEKDFHLPKHHFQGCTWLPPCTCGVISNSGISGLTEFGPRKRWSLCCYNSIFIELHFKCQTYHQTLISLHSNLMIIQNIVGIRSHLMQRFSFCMCSKPLVVLWLQTLRKWWIGAISIQIRQVGNIFHVLKVETAPLTPLRSHHLIISPSHHLIISPSHHLIISSSHHLIISSSHHLIISRSHHLTISPSHHLIISSSHHLIISSSHHRLSLVEGWIHSMFPTFGGVLGEIHVPTFQGDSRHVAASLGSRVVRVPPLRFCPKSTVTCTWGGPRTTWLQYAWHLWWMGAFMAGTLATGRLFCTLLGRHVSLQESHQYGEYPTALQLRDWPLR